MRKPVIFSCIAFCFYAIGFGASTLNFPRLSFEADSIMGIAIVNPGNEVATATFTAYGEDGQPLAGPGLTNPVNRQVPPGRQYADITQSLFGTGLDPSTVAWIQATSESDGLTGFFLLLNNTVTYFDGADLPLVSKELVFGDVRVDQGFSTEVNLVNLGPGTADVKLSLVGGETAVDRTIQIADHGAARLDVATLFDGVAVPENAYLRVSSSRPALGFELVRGPGDLIGLNAKPASELLNTMVFPQIAVLGGIQTELVVDNPSAQDVILTATVYQPNGRLFGAPEITTNPVTLALPAGGILREDLAVMFGFSGSVPREGWLQVVANSPAVNGSVNYSLPALNSQARAAVSSLSRGATRAVFSHLATSLNFFTGVAVLNTGSLAANIRFVALAPDGSVLGVFSTVVPPGQRISRLITELIPMSANQAGGMIWVTSDIPVFSSSLFGNLQSGVLANIPPQPVPSDFRPDMGITRLRLQPPLAVISPSNNQPFSVQGAAGAPEWRVNGEAGGNANVGTVNAQGVYQAPATPPTELPVIVSALVAGQTAAATVDVLRRDVLVGNLGQVQSIAYLKGLNRLYSAELTGTGLSGIPGLRLQQSEGSTIYDISDQPTPVATFPNDNIRKIIPYQGLDGREYLLLANSSSGRITRLDPQTRQSVDVVDGLNSVTAIVLDSATGDLLVAEGPNVTRISRNALNAGLSAARTGPAVPKGRWRVAVLPVDLSGIALDSCTGDIYVSSAASGQLYVVDPNTGSYRSLFSGLLQPSQLLAVQRAGVDCPSSLHLLVAEPGRDQITLITLDNETVTRWVPANDPTDCVFVPEPDGLGVLPKENQVLFPERTGAGTTGAGTTSQVVGVDTGSIYQPLSINPLYGPGVIEFEFEVEILGADPSLGLSQGDRIIGRFFYNSQAASSEVYEGFGVAIYEFPVDGAGLDVVLNGRLVSFRGSEENPSYIQVWDDLASEDGPVYDLFALYGPEVEGESSFSLAIIDETDQMITGTSLPDDLPIVFNDLDRTGYVTVNDPNTVSGSLFFGFMRSVQRVR